MLSPYRQKEIWTNIIEMFKVRGCLINIEYKENYLNIHSKKPTFIFENKIRGIKNYVYIIIKGENEKVNAKILKEYITNFKGFSVESKQMTIIYTDRDINKSSKGWLNKQKGINIESFDIDDFGFNLLEHDLVPHYDWFTNEDGEQILESEGLDVNYISKIKFEDPISRYFGVMVGDIFRVTNFKLPIKIGYRVVIN